MHTLAPRKSFLHQGIRGDNKPAADGSGHHCRKTFSGFTLVELMITLVIAAILVAIAVPIYQHVQERARRTEAINALEALAAREEGYYTRYNTYTTSLTGLGYSSAATVTTSGGDYGILVLSANATAYKLQATPISKRQTNDACGVFQLDSKGQQTVIPNGTGISANSCWH